MPKYVCRSHDRSERLLEIIPSLKTTEDVAEATFHSREDGTAWAEVSFYLSDEDAERVKNDTIWDRD